MVFCLPAGFPTACVLSQRDSHWVRRQVRSHILRRSILFPYFLADLKNPNPLFQILILPAFFATREGHMTSLCQTRCKQKTEGRLLGELLPPNKKYRCKNRVPWYYSSPFVLPWNVDVIPGPVEATLQICGIGMRLRSFHSRKTEKFWILDDITELPD